jgi:hypothetical protein
MWRKGNIFKLQIVVALLLGLGSLAGVLRTSIPLRQPQPPRQPHPPHQPQPLRLPQAPAKWNATELNASISPNWRRRIWRRAGIAVGARVA